jgi:hypothetical protein
MSTDELIERLRAARTDDATLEKARRLLAEARRLGRDAGLTPVAALTRVCGDYTMAHAVVAAAGRVSRVTRRWPRELQVRLLALCLAD